MEAWYENSFGQDYLIVYKHRDMGGAVSEVNKMIDWLALPQDAKVFDLCCGMGRHSMALAEYGYEVTGLDLSEVLLSEAKRLDGGGRVKWLKGDMRRIPENGPFDAVVNLFTSFGYFDEQAENEQVLHEISRILADGGRFILDYLNANFVVRNLVPHSERTEGNLRIEENRSIEEGFVRKRIAISEPGRDNRHYLEQVRLYGLSDFERMTAAAGLVIDRVYGSPEGEAYDSESSKRLILVGHKKEAE